MVVGICALAKDKERHIYKGDSTKHWDIIYTYDGEHIYKGDSRKYWDVIYTIEKE